MERLQARIRLAREDDEVLGMFFDSALRKIAELAGVVKADEVRTSIVGQKRLVGFFRYPVSDLLRAMQHGGELSKGAFAETMESFGSAAVDDFFASPVGKTLKTVAGSNVHRIIASAPPSYRACASFGSCTYEKLGDSAARLRFDGELMGPSAQVGIVRAVLRSACKLEPEITVDVQDDAGTRFDVQIRW